MLVSEAPYPTVQVLADGEDRWIQARRIWNQHSYHVTNVREDATIPQFEPKNWLDLNTFGRMHRSRAGRSASRLDEVRDMKVPKGADPEAAAAREAGDYQAKWGLLGGAMPKVVGSNIKVTEKGKRAKQLRGIHVDYDVDAIALRPDFGALMLRSQTITSPEWFERPAQPIVDHLAEVTREGDEAFLRIADATYLIHGPSAADVAPPAEEDEGEEWDD